MSKMVNKNLAYGLDFGTSNSAVSILRKGIVKVLPINYNEVRPEVFPSAMYFKGEKVIFASAATREYLEDLRQADLATKKKIATGETMTVWQGSEKIIVDQVVEYEDYGVGRMIRSFKSVLGNQDNFTTNIVGRTMNFEELLATFIGEIKRRADMTVGQDVKKVVIGRPVKFVGDESGGVAPIKHLTNAARLAGFEEVGFEYEPVGAAYGYGMEDKGKILIYDFGGGTLDITVVETKPTKVLASWGTPLGGDLIDLALYEEYIAKYLGKHLKYGQKQLQYPRRAVEQMISWYDVTDYRTKEYFNFLESIRYLANEPETVEFIRFFLKANLSFPLRKKIVEAKESLTDKNEVDFIFQTVVKTIRERWEKGKFEELVGDYVAEAEGVMATSLKMAGVRPEEIGKVVMTGGSSLVPVFRRSVEKMFGAEKVVLYEPFTAVSKGLAMVAHDRMDG